jgi:hypothetical protein
MVNNYMCLELGGIARGLKFNIGTLRCLSDVAGIDPIDFKAESNKLNDLLPFAEKIFHAALLSNCLSKKDAPDFTKEDISEWFNDLDFKTVTSIINHYNSIFNTGKESANGEVSKDTQPGEAVNV